MSIELLLTICSVLLQQSNSNTLFTIILSICGFLLAAMFAMQININKKVMELGSDMAEVKTTIKGQDKICGLKHVTVDKRLDDLEKSEC